MDFSFHYMKTKENIENAFLKLGSTSIPFFLSIGKIILTFHVSEIRIAEFSASNLYIKICMVNY